MMLTLTIIRLIQSPQIICYTENRGGGMTLFGENTEITEFHRKCDLFMSKISKYGNKVFFKKSIKANKAKTNIKTKLQISQNFIFHESVSSLYFYTWGC